MNDEWSAYAAQLGRSLISGNQLTVRFRGTVRVEKGPKLHPTNPLYLQLGPEPLVRPHGLNGAGDQAMRTLYGLPRQHRALHI